MRTLLDLEPGQPATIASVGEPLAANLAELGFLPGESLRVLARAGLGGPLAVRVGSSVYALRREEAVQVRVL